MSGPVALGFWPMCEKGNNKKKNKWSLLSELDLTKEERPTCENL